MISTYFRFKAYLNYLSRSGTRHSVHSPFVYSLINEVFKNRFDHNAIRDIEKLRSHLLQKTQLIEITDFGAGANGNQYKHRFESVAALARNSSIDVKFGSLLFRLVEYFKPKTIIELGTSLGISTLYLAKANPDCLVHTVEGCTAKSEQASIGFDSLNAKNILQYIGSFKVVLPDLIEKIGTFDLAFVDGHHTYEATVANFETLLPIVNNDSILIFDDIHWSPDMEKAWNVIINHQKVMVSIDLFRIGIVFFKKELSKQKFIIRF